MKKIILTLSGVLFVIVTGCSLLICMMNGIPNLDQPAAAFYLAKAILLSLPSSGNLRSLRTLFAA